MIGPQLEHGGAENNLKIVVAIEIRHRRGRPKKDVPRSLRIGVGLKNFTEHLAIMTRSDTSARWPGTSGKDRKQGREGYDEY